MLLCFRCVNVATGTLSAPSGCPSKGSHRWLSSVSLATNVLFLFYLFVFFTYQSYQQDRLQCFNVMMLLNDPPRPPDLNRFTTSRWSISKSTVCVSFPLTHLDLGPYGPVDCGNKKQSFFTASPWRVSLTHPHVGAIGPCACGLWFISNRRKQSVNLWHNTQEAGIPEFFLFSLKQFVVLLSFVGGPIDFHVNFSNYFTSFSTSPAFHALSPFFEGSNLANALQSNCLGVCLLPQAPFYTIYMQYVTTPGP